MAHHYAFKDTECADCGTTILQDDPIYFSSPDGLKVCKGCGTANGAVCPQCDGQKKAQFDTCWDCRDAKRESSARDSKPAGRNRPISR